MAGAIPYILLGGAMALLLFLNVGYQLHWLDSDMAAEMIFSRLLAEEGHIFAASDWYYSTEFRVLYTQLLMGPLFRISDNWHLIRTITNEVFYVLLLASYFYFMKPFSVKRHWTVLTSVLLLLPFSETMMTHMQMGNTYMSHVILIFLFFGMFLRLASGTLKKGRKLWVLLLYIGLGVICGLSGVRYLLALQCPLVLASGWFLVGTEEFQGFRRAPGKENLKALAGTPEAAYLGFGLLGAAAGILGYGINVLVVSRQYVFQTYEATNFISLYQGVLMERLQNALGCFLMLFGYIPDKGFLSLRGLVTLAAFAMAALCIFCCRKVHVRRKGRRGDARRFTVLFLAVAFFLNVFVFVFTTSTMVPRYYITLFIFALPVLAFYAEEPEYPFDRVCVFGILGCCMLLATAKTVFSFVTTDKNEDKYRVAAFLEEEGYHFGFATYTNGNIITEITNGTVEIANVNGAEYLDYFTWSSPMKYYEETYREGEEVFLLLTRGEEAEAAGEKALQTGVKVYEDEYYAVYVYESRQALKACAKTR